MRLHRFIGQFDLSESTLSLVEPSLRHQLTRVFRMKVGDELLLCNGNNTEARVRIDAMDAHEISVSVLERYAVEKNRKHEVWLFLSLIKNDHVELVVEKVTELGVAKITPVISGRTIKKSVRRERLQAIAREAAEQCGRGTVPEICEPLPLKEAFSISKDCVVRLFCDMGGVEVQSVTGLNNKSIALFIGPEGGWTDEERQLAKDENCTAISLGQSVLRAETAAMVGVYELVR